MHETLLVDLVSGLDKSIQHYISKAISGYGKQNFIKYDLFFLIHIFLIMMHRLALKLYVTFIL